MFDAKLLVQIVLVVALVIATIVIVLPGRGARGQAIRKLFILGAGLVGVAFVVFPDWSTSVANLLGIGRGVDLILYGAVVIGIGFAITMNLRVHRAERSVTMLARRMAILEAERDEEKLAEGGGTRRD